jgi:tetratricopeptide (TPR) repeat protein
MKQFILIIGLCLFGSWLYAQDAKTYVYKGNKLYSQKKYDEAAAEYNKSVGDKNIGLQGNFNLGDALFKQKKFDDAAQHFTDIGSTANNAGIKADAYHNLGNTLMESKKYQESVDAYEKSLLNNPKDDQTRYNLAYAQEKLKQQQQQKKNQDKNNKDNKNQQNKDKQKQDQDKKDQDKKNQDKKDQQNKDQQKQDPNKMSKDDAQRMLDALNNNEKNTQDKLKNKKFKAGRGQIDKDW